MSTEIRTPYECADCGETFILILKVSDSGALEGREDPRAEHVKKTSHCVFINKEIQSG